jgi:hypothetical protein
MLFMVYDKRGEPFEVRPHVAKNLVIQEGWSMEAPVVAVAPAVAPVGDESPAPATSA